ncbi:MAG: hypothetical protein AAFP92_05185 [Bacteroidota bacterium]
MNGFQNCFLILSVLFIGGCNVELPIDEIVRIQLSNDTIVGDGTSTISISAFISSRALESRRSVTFYTDEGIFVGSNDKKITVTARKAVDVDKDSLKAMVTFVAPMVPGKVAITTEIEDIFISDTIKVVASTPSSVSLTADRFAVPVDFLGEIKFTATIRNSIGKKVSKGIGVIFEDKTEVFSPVGGIFRDNSEISGTDSNVTINYTPGRFPSDSSFLIIATVLNQEGNKTNFSDTLRIFTL